MDDRFQELKKQRAWAKVIKKRKEVEMKQTELDNLKTKKTGIEQKVLKLEQDRQKFEDEKCELLKEDQTGLQLESDFKMKVSETKEEIKRKQNESKRLETELKTIDSKRKAVQAELKVLDKTKDTFKEGPSKETLFTIDNLKLEQTELVKVTGAGEQAQEELESTILILNQEVKNKEGEMRVQQQEAASLKREVAVLEREKEADQEGRGAFPGSRQVEQELGRRKAEFLKPPIGPVGRYVKVISEDSNLVSLVEQELGPKLLRAYLVDNEQDRKVLSSILDRQYGATAAKPMVITSKFLTRRHPVQKPAVQGGNMCLLDLVEVQGGEEVQVVVFNSLVDQRGVEAVVVSRTQEDASLLCTVLAKVPRGLSTCITEDWYRFHPPTTHTSYRSYYINKYSSVYLTPCGGEGRLRAKQEEVAEVEKVLARLHQELADSKEEIRLLKEQVVRERDELGRSRRKMQDVTMKLRKAEQQRQIEEDLEGPARIEAQILDNTKIIAELDKKSETKKKEQSKLVDAIDDAKTKFAIDRFNLSELSSKSLPLRSNLETVYSAVKAIETKKHQMEQKLKKLTLEEEASAVKVNESVTELEAIKEQAKEATDGVELTPAESYESLQAKVNTILKERLGREETDYGSQALASYRRLSEEIQGRSRRVAELKVLYQQLEEQMGSRKDLFQAIRDKVITLVERRFSLLARQTLASMQIELSIDPSKKQLSFTFGAERRSSKVASLSGGEKSYSQLCLILSLWCFMGTPFRCLDEWDVFLDSVNRAQIGAELTKFAREQEGVTQFIFLSPQGAVEAPPNSGQEFRVFTLGEGPL